MDTFLEVSFYSSDKEHAKGAIDRTFKEARRIEKVFNRFDEKSEINRINTFAGQEKINISPEVFSLIERCIYYSEITNGSFDITVEPMEKGRYRNIVLDRKTSSIYFSEEDIRIDMGGVVKGYTVDKIKEILDSEGVKSALINLGGNIYAVGSPPHKDNWRIGIRDPRDKRDIIYSMDLKDRAVATSADYERPSHIIDPLKGSPVLSRASVTIIADSAERADAFSTAVFVMGPEQGRKFIESLDDVELFIFD